ncbi:MAG: glycosyltransferase family 87 protein [Terracidiphilus sp.]
MANARLDGLYLLVLGGVVFLFFGLTMEYSSPVSMVDFGVLYFPARSLFHHGDPYKQNEVLRAYLADGGEHLWDSPKDREIVTRYQYLPTSFCVTAPLALLPWNIARILWISLTAGGLMLAAFLLWNLSADYAPVLSGGLIGFLLANSVVVIVLGNAAGIVISLCIISVWCLLRERFVPLGIFGLATGLALKPHDVGFVWLFFLLAGGVYRKRALQTVGATAVIGLPGVLWVWVLSPGWVKEWESNLAVLAAHSGVTDPGPASTGSHGLGMLINLQAAISVFWDNPGIYQPIAYIVAGSLLAVWAAMILCSRISFESAWLAIAAVSALSLLPVYHHLYDATLMLLAVPACSMLWARTRIIGRIAMVVTSLAFIFAGDFTWTIILTIIGRLHLPATKLTWLILTSVQVLPAPLTILLMGVFYLCTFARSRAGIDWKTQAQLKTRDAQSPARLEAALLPPTQ